MLEALEDRNMLATLTWVGPTGGNWSVAANWTPAQVPGNGDIVQFLGGTKNTDSAMDLGGGAFYHIARLVIDDSYTKTITLGSDLYVDRLAMAGGTVEGNKKLVIWQRTDDPSRVATDFGTSLFARGTIKSNMEAKGEETHRVTLVLAGDLGLGWIPKLEANLTTDHHTSMEWTNGSVSVAGGKTITNGGTFLADSGGTMGNPDTVWNLINTGKLYKGKGTFQKANVVSTHGKIFKVASEHAGGSDTFLVQGSVSLNDNATVEVVSGTLAISGTYTQTAGSTLVNAGQTLSISETFSHSAGSTYLDAGATLEVAGALDYTGGTFGMEDAILVDNEGFNIGSSVTFSGTGTIEGDVVAAGAWTLGDSYESPVSLAITGNVTLDGNTLYVHSGQLNVGGDFTHNATILYLAGNALLEIDGDFQQTGGITTHYGPSGYQSTFTIGGSFTLDGGTFTLGMSAWMAVEGAVTLSDGLLTLETGEAQLTVGSGLSIGGNGQLAAVGTIVGNVTNAGILRSSLWPVAGLLSIQGNYTQSSTGTLHATIDEFGGGDQFQVSGQATLDGAFVLTLQPNGSPYSGPYTVLSSSSRSGTFASLSLPDLNSGYFWDWSYASGLSLWVEFDM